MNAVIPVDSSEWNPNYLIGLHGSNGQYCNYDPSLLNNVPVAGSPLYAIHIAYAFARSYVFMNADRRPEDLDWYDMTFSQWLSDTLFGYNLPMATRDGSLSYRNLSRICRALSGMGVFYMIGHDKPSFSGSKLARSQKITSTTNTCTGETTTDDDDSDSGSDGAYTDQEAQAAASSLLKNMCSDALQFGQWTGAPSVGNASPLSASDMSSIFGRAKYAKYFCKFFGNSILGGEVSFSESEYKSKTEDRLSPPSEGGDRCVSGSGLDYISYYACESDSDPVPDPDSILNKVCETGKTSVPNINQSNGACGRETYSVQCVVLFKVTRTVNKYEATGSFIRRPGTSPGDVEDVYCFRDITETQSSYVAVKSGEFECEMESDGNSNHYVRKDSTENDKLFTSSDVTSMYKQAYELSGLPIVRTSLTYSIANESYYKDPSDPSATLEWQATSYEGVGIKYCGITIKPIEGAMFFCPSYLSLN